MVREKARGRQICGEAGGATLTVFDAGNSSMTVLPIERFHHGPINTRASLYKPVFGTALLGLVKQAIAARVQAAERRPGAGAKPHTDRPQVNGLAANVVFVPTEIWPVNRGRWSYTPVPPSTPARLVTYTT